LVNSIVLQAWEAAHGCDRDLVIGITGPTGFRAHAWLDGDPHADDAGMAASELGSNGARRRSAAVPEAASPTGRDERNPTPYVELLRRSSPRSEHK
jgi:hypothetical protein